MADSVKWQAWARGLGVTLGLVTAAVLVVLAVAGTTDSSWALAFVGYPLVGGVLLWQRPGNGVGWLMVAIGTCMATSQVGLVLLERDAEVSVGFESAVQTVGAMGWLTLIALVACFPSGRPERSLDRWAVGGCLVVGVAILVAYVTASGPMELTGRTNPWAVPALEDFSAFMRRPGFSLALGLLVVAVVGLARRWRAAEGADRMPYRWVALAAAVALLVLVLGNVVFGDEESGPLALLVSVVVINLIPLAIGMAVARYRLYDIDRLVSRTVTYAAVSVVVVATYAVVVTTVTRLLPTSSTLAVAAATLAAAAVARPLLRRVQAVVDRRFNRSRYDAQRTVDAFGERLRNEVESGTVVADLRGVVATTLEPKAVALWLPTP